jgi:hypothetical protein
MPELNDGSMSIAYGRTAGMQSCSRCTLLTHNVVYIQHDDGRPVTNVVHLCWLCQLKNTPQPRIDPEPNVENNRVSHNGNLHRGRV